MISRFPNAEKRRHARRRFVGPFLGAPFAFGMLLIVIVNPGELFRLWSEPPPENRLIVLSLEYRDGMMRQFAVPAEREPIWARWQARIEQLDGDIVCAGAGDSEYERKTTPVAMDLHTWTGAECELVVGHPYRAVATWSYVTSGGTEREISEALEFIYREPRRVEPS